MQFFKDPVVIAITLALCSVVLGAIGIFLAVRGVRAAEGQGGKAFISIGKMERNFRKAEKLRANRSVIYIGVWTDGFLDAYAQKFAFREIKLLLLTAFDMGEDASISSCDEKSCVVFAKWDAQTVMQKVEDCHAELNKCLLKYGALNLVDIRMGICLNVGSQVTLDEAIDRAKQACILARDEKQPYAQWDVSSGKALAQRIKIENNIEKEIDNNRFFLEYQPVLDAKTRKIIGAEVLSRLNSETDGVLPPRSFLSAVDSVGIHGKFDYYIFEKNCKWISHDKKQREGYQYTINFSRATLCEPAFVEKVVGIAQKYNLNLSCLAVEILEDKDVSGDAKKQMMDNLTLLREKGMAVLLDDFGSGYTTFGDLQNLDISIVKIDKSITQNAVTETGFIILKNIINTSQSIGFKTLCEGIETQEHEDAAIRAGCDLLQGFYYYKPMSVAALERLLDSSQEES